MPRYAAALALTLAVEAPLYVAALAWGWRAPFPRASAAALGVNALTHPILWFALAPTLGLFASEAIVCLAEALMLMAWLRRRDWLLLVVAIAVNAASVLAGFTAAF